MGTWDDYFATGEEFVTKCPTSRGTTPPAASPRRCSTRSRTPSRPTTTPSTSTTPTSRASTTRHRQHRQGPVHHARPVERRLDRLLPERRLRDDGLPRLDARRHRGQRRGRRGLGLRQRLPRRRRQLGRLVPDRPRPGRPHRGGQGGRRLADRAGAAGQGLRRRRAPSPARSTPWTRQEITSATNEFFNNAPTGEILADRAEAVTVQPYKGPKYSDILTGVPGGDPPRRRRLADPDESWDQFLPTSSALG